MSDLIAVKNNLWWIIFLGIGMLRSLVLRIRQAFMLTWIKISSNYTFNLDEYEFKH